MNAHSLINQNMNKKKEYNKRILNIEKINFDNTLNNILNNNKEDKKIKNVQSIPKNNSLTMNNSHNKNLIIHYIKKSLYEEEKRSNEILKIEREKIEQLKNELNINKGKNLEKKTFSGIKITTYFNNNKLETYQIPFLNGQIKIKEWLKKYNKLLSSLELFNLPDSYKLQIINTNYNENNYLKNNLKIENESVKSIIKNKDIEILKSKIINKSFSNGKEILKNKMKKNLNYSVEINKKNLSKEKNNNFINNSQIFRPDSKINLNNYLSKTQSSREKEKKINKEKNIKIPIKLFYKINNKILERQLNKSKDDNKKNINKLNNGVDKKVHSERRQICEKNISEFKNVKKNDNNKYKRNEKEKHFKEKIKSSNENLVINKHLQSVKQINKENIDTKIIKNNQSITIDKNKKIKDENKEKENEETKNKEKEDENKYIKEKKENKIIEKEINENENNEEIIILENTNILKNNNTNFQNNENISIIFKKFIVENNIKKNRKIISDLYININSKEPRINIINDEEMNKPNKKIINEEIIESNKNENLKKDDNLTDKKDIIYLEEFKPVLKKRKQKPSTKNFDVNNLLSLTIEKEKEQSQKKLLEKARNLRQKLKHKKD